jgi:riboflavin kinase / FMN hydrolase
MRVQAAQAAAMQVIGIPSLVGKQWYSSCNCTMLASLLDIKPEEFGLPLFEDHIHGTVPLEEPWKLKGNVVKGFGRGSKVRVHLAKALQ